MTEIELLKVSEPEHLLQTPVPPCERGKLTELKPNHKVKYPGGLIIFATLPKEQLEACRQTIVKAPTGSHSRLAAKNVAGDEGPQRSFDTTFGYKPSRPVFGHTAGPVRYTTENPKGFKALTALGEYLEGFCREQIGEEFRAQEEKAKTLIRPEYRIGETGFTQGVINRSNALNWHYDKGNFENSYSAMLWVLEGGIAGGELVIPSFGVFVEPIDGGVFIFKGQNLIHGVAPVRKTKPKSDRMSVVFYTNADLAKAESVDEELKKSKLREFRKHFK